MGDKHLTAVVIGGGIHGVTASIALARNGVDVTLIEKNERLFQGTSGATQNRAHLGYHYPRSVATASECFEGLTVFRQRYPGALAYPKEAYYLIDKESSRVSVDQYRAFCDQMRIPYETAFPAERFLNRQAVAGSFRVPEPVFNLEVLADLLVGEVRELGIAVRTGWEVVEAAAVGDRFQVTAAWGRDRMRCEADILLNATYAYTNNILDMLGLEDEMTPYTLQYTEVPIARCEVEVPALTVMDGEFISVLPYGHKQDYVLVYDVVHSVVHRENGYLFNDGRRFPTNWASMIEHGQKYFPFIRNLAYVGSLWGARPIPVNAGGDSRKTRLVGHRHRGAYSILEGKFISAPLMADRLLDQLRTDGLLSGRSGLRLYRQAQSV